MSRIAQMLIQSAQSINHIGVGNVATSCNSRGCVRHLVLARISISIRTHAQAFILTNMHRKGLIRQTVLDTIFVSTLDLLIIIKLLTQQPDCTRLLIFGSCLSVYSFLRRFVSLDNMLTKLILELKRLILQTTNFDIFTAY